MARVSVVDLGELQSRVERARRSLDSARKNHEGNLKRVATSEDNLIKARDALDSAIKSLDDGHRSVKGDNR